MLFTGATVWAGAECVPRPAWLLVEDGLVARIGGPDEPPPAGPAHVGGHVLPGLVDVHSHLTLAALLPSRGAAGWRSVGDALAGVARAAAADPDAPWLLFSGADPQSWPQARLPDADELEGAAPGRNVLVCGVDLHRGTVSRTGLAHVRGYDRDRTRRPGELWEAAFGATLARALHDLRAREVDLTGLLRAEARRHLALGLTHAHDPFVPPSLHAALRALDTALPVSWATGPEAGMLTPPAEVPEGAGEVKVFLDGADRCALRLPVTALPGLVAGTLAQGWRRRSLGPVREGLRRKVTLRGGHLETPYLRLGDAELVALLAGYAEAGLRVRLHALGNRAAEQAARALVTSGFPAGAATVDHLAVLDARTADLVAASGAHASYQPGFRARFGPAFAALGVHRHLTLFGGRLLTAAGAPLVLSSDHPCGPLDPLANLRAAVTGDQALTPAQAVRAATVGARRSLGLPAAGLVPGAPATLTVCTGDPFAPGTRVAQTWVGGARAWP